MFYVNVIFHLIHLFYLNFHIVLYFEYFVIISIFLSFLISF